MEFNKKYLNYLYNRTPLELFVQKSSFIKMSQIYLQFIILNIYRG